MAIKDLHVIIDGLLSQLFHSDFKRIAKWTDRIIEKNQRISGNRSPIVIYAGRFYRHTSAITSISGAKPSIHESLVPEMEDLVYDLSVTERQRQFSRQALFTLLHTCSTMQDLRDALPDCLTNCIKGLSQYPRQRPVAYTLQYDPRSKRQFEAMLPTIEAYSASRLI